MTRVVLTDEERRERDREKCRRWRRDNPEKARAAYQGWNNRNPEKRRQLSRESKLRGRHGRDVERWLTEAWEQQQGKCYLCGDPLSHQRGSGPTRYRGAIIEHDHACCPQARSCQYCRRGLACSACNVLLGYAADDLDRLLRIVANARPVFARTRERIAAKPHQGTLL